MKGDAFPAGDYAFRNCPSDDSPQKDIDLFYVEVSIGLLNGSPEEGDVLHSCHLTEALGSCTTFVVSLIRA